MGASLFEFRDLDLMLKLDAEADDDGWVETQRMAESLGFEESRNIGSRLSWMRRYGMVEFDEHRRMWRLSPGGVRVTEAKLRAAQARTIEALPDEAMIGVMANIGTRYHHGDAMVAQMLRREFLYGTSPARQNGRRRR